MIIKNRRNNGFTIVETVFAMSIVGIFIAAALTGIAFCTFTTRQNIEQSRATQILVEKFETIRIYSWEQINTPGFIPTNFFSYQDPDNAINKGIRYMGTLTISPVNITNSYANDLFQFTVRLDWRTGNDGMSHTREWTGFVGKNSIHKVQGPPNYFAFPL